MKLRKKISRLLFPDMWERIEQLELDVRDLRKTPMTQAQLEVDAWVPAADVTRSELRWMSDPHVGLPRGEAASERQWPKSVLASLGSNPANINRIEPFTGLFGVVTDGNRMARSTPLRPNKFGDGVNKLSKL